MKFSFFTSKISKILLEVAFSTPGRIPLKFLKKATTFPRKNPQKLENKIHRPRRTIKVNEHKRFTNDSKENK